MNRRTFLTIGVGLAGGLLTGTAGARRAAVDPAALVRQSACRPRWPALRPVAWRSSTEGALSFAGTRLFKEGFLDELAMRYTKSTGRTIRILGGGCDDGVSAVLRGEAQLGGVCCRIRGGLAGGLGRLPVAQDLKVVVAHPSVGLADIRSRELRDVVTGRIRDWSRLNAGTAPIALVAHDHCPDYLEPVRDALLGPGGRWSPNALFVKTDQQHLETIARLPHAIGVNSWILAEPFVRAGRLKVLALDGVTPSVAAAAAGRYRLVGPLNMVFRAWDANTMQPFFDFLYSDAGATILRQRVAPVPATQIRYPTPNSA